MSLSRANARPRYISRSGRSVQAGTSRIQTESAGLKQNRTKKQNFKESTEFPKFQTRIRAEAFHLFTAHAFQFTNKAENVLSFCIRIRSEPWFSRASWPTHTISI